MKFKKTKCKGCKIKESPLFVMPKAESGDDIWCPKCMEEEQKKRGTL